MLAKAMIFWSGLVSALPLSVVDAAPIEPNEHGSFSILVENDVFYKSDRDYTAGEALAYTTSANETPLGLINFGRALPVLFGQGDVLASYQLGQDIFTPA